MFNSNPYIIFISQKTNAGSKAFCFFGEFLYGYKSHSGSSDLVGIITNTTFSWYLPYGKGSEAYYQLNAKDYTANYLAFIV